jgi:hypothetical protein
MSYHCSNINSYLPIIDDSSKVVLIVLCSSIDANGGRSLLLLAYERVGFKKATSLISLVHVKEVSLLTFPE